MRAIDNKYIGASKLSEDFLDVSDQTVTILTAGRREAPSLFRSNGSALLGARCSSHRCLRDIAGVGQGCTG